MSPDYSYRLEAFPPEGSVDFVKFKLVYDGPLPPDGRAAVGLKQGIRAHFHPQLLKLWSDHPALSRMMIRHPDNGLRTVDKIGADYAKGPYRFVPLVRLKNQMAWPSGYSGSSADRALPSVFRG
jgi:hypothetical protein